jgi:hypothetical protein
VVKYHGLGYRHPAALRALMRPQLKSGRLGGWTGYGARAPRWSNLSACTDRVSLLGLMSQRLGKLLGALAVMSASLGVVPPVVSEARRLISLHYVARLLRSSLIVCLAYYSAAPAATASVRLCLAAIVLTELRTLVSPLIDRNAT